MTAAILAVAAVLYALCARAYYVGFFNDDAFYILGARALAHGHAPLAQYFPGYPLLLAPLARVCGDALWPYQFASIIFGVVGLLFFARSLKDESAGVRTAALALAAFNPLAASLSATVLSDIPFWTASIAALFYARVAWDEDAPRRWVAPALLAAAGCLLRPTGLALTAGLAAALCLERRWKTAALCAAPSVLALAALACWRLPYAVEFAAPYRAGGVLPAFRSNAAYYLDFLFERTLFRSPLENVPLKAGICVLGVAFAAVGARGARGWRLAAVLYMAFYLGVHLLWSKQAGRYLYPIAPLAAWLLLRGAGKADRRAVTALVALSLALSLAPIVRIARASLRERTAVTTPPERTYAWIRAQAAPEDLVATELDGRFSLLAGRRAVHWTGSIDDLPERLEKEGVRWAALFSSGAVMRTASGSSPYDPLDEDAVSRRLQAAGWRRAFADTEEGSSIYRLE